jgi:hypothetical protein
MGRAITLPDGTVVTGDDVILKTLPDGSVTITLPAGRVIPPVDPDSVDPSAPDGEVQKPSEIIKPVIEGNPNPTG